MLMMTDLVKVAKVMETLLISATSAINMVILQESVQLLLKVVVMLATSATRKVTLPKTVLMLTLDLRATKVADLIVLKVALTVVSLVICQENVLNQETKQEALEVVEEEDQMAISVEMVRIKVIKSAIDATKPVTLLENVLILVMMTEVARVTRDNVVMMVALLTEKVGLMTTMQVQATFRLAGAVLITLVRAGTAMKMLLT